MSDLTSINYQKFTPSGPLSAYVQAIWLAKKTENSQVLPFKILSDCGASVIFNFADSLQLARDSESAAVDHNGVVIGPSKDLLGMTFNGSVNALGIHFLASGGHVFFSQAMNALANRFVNNEHNIFLGGAELSDKLLSVTDNKTPQVFIDIIENHLLKELKQYETHAQKRLRHLIQLVEADPNFSLQELADMLKVSTREVQRIFKQFVGVAPNTFLRVNKINQAKAKIANNEFSSLTQLAIDSGYFDQAHFIRDFKSFMQATPKQYQKRKQL